MIHTTLARLPHFNMPVRTSNMMPLSRPVVLVVDDGPKNIKLMEGILVPAGYTVISADNGVNAEVRMYDRLFMDPQPDAGGKDFIESLNPNSLKVVTAIIEPSLANALPDQKFQFERHGYFVADRIDHVQGTRPVFNLAVGLKDSWGK